MMSMFRECKSLTSLPDISKWNTNNVKDMSSMFEGCSSLSSLPKWKIHDVTIKKNMFKGCKNRSFFSKLFV